MDLQPYPNYLIVGRVNKEADSDGGIFVPRQDQEETEYAVVLHAGESDHKVGSYIIVQPHAGTDLLVDGESVTIMNIKKEVLAEVEI